MKKFLLFASLTVGHFIATKGVVAIGMAGGMPSAYSPEGPALLTRFLVLITKILYFPLITLSLYPRQLFPGGYINIPILANSLIWAAFLYALFRLAKRRSAA